MPAQLPLLHPTPPLLSRSASGKLVAGGLSAHRNNVEGSS